MPRVEVSAVLFGRDTETGFLTAMTARAAAGRGAAVLLDGEPGIGKSALLDVVAQRCVPPGMRVLRGGAESLERLLPFSTVAACLGMRATIVDPDVAPVAGLLRGEQTSLVGWTQEGDGLSRGAAANHDFVV